MIRLILLSHFTFSLSFRRTTHSQRRLGRIWGGVCGVCVWGSQWASSCTTRGIPGYLLNRPAMQAPSWPPPGPAASICLFYPAATSIINTTAPSPSSDLSCEAIPGRGRMHLVALVTIKKGGTNQQAGEEHGCNNQDCDHQAGR